MRALGIDPGTLKTGFGLIEINGSFTRAIDYGVIRTDSEMPLHNRLSIIFSGIDRIIGKHGPDVVVIEEIFYRKNFKSAVMIGEARGVAMLAAARNSVDVVGYPPAQVKQAVVGNGRASKSQMQKMVQHLLDLKEFPAEDAADALAIALCYSHRSATRNKLSLPHAGVNC